jgi:hypothetical protein
VWAASELEGTVTRIDPAKNRVAGRIDVHSTAAGAAVDGDALWVTTRGAPSSHRGGTLKVTASGTLGITSLDPALWRPDYLIHAQFLGLTNDGLVGNKRVGGLDGSTIVANLAAAVPRRPTDGVPPTRSSCGRGSATRPAGW